VQKWNENRDIAKNVPLFGHRKLKIGAKVERKSRYCKKRSTIWVQKAENERKSGTTGKLMKANGKFMKRACPDLFLDFAMYLCYNIRGD